MHLQAQDTEGGGSTKEAREDPLLQVLEGAQPCRQLGFGCSASELAEDQCSVVFSAPAPETLFQQPQETDTIRNSEKTTHDGVRLPYSRAGALRTGLLGQGRPTRVPWTTRTGGPPCCQVTAASGWERHSDPRRGKGATRTSTRNPAQQGHQHSRQPPAEGGHAGPYS